MKSLCKLTSLTTNSTMILFALLFVHACSMPHKQDALLQSADSLMKLRPDSALSILESIAPGSLTTPADRAKYALLLTQAQDKNYIAHTSDSLINIAVDYYDSIDDKALAAKAHYYLGSVYQDMNNAPKAVKQYSIALALAQKTGDYDLICLSQGNMAHIFYLQGLLDRADSIYRQVELLAMQHNDSSRLVVILRTRGDICMERQDKDEALILLEKAYSISQKLKNKRSERMVANSLSSLYSRMNNGILAETFARKFLQLCDSSQQYEGYILLGDALFRQELFDSAAFYVTKSLVSDIATIRQGAYMRLSDIARLSKDFELAIRIEDSVQVYREKALLKKQPVAVIEAQKEAQSHNMVRSIEEAFSRYRYFVGIFLVVSICILCIVGYRRRKERLKIDKKQHESQMQKNQLESALRQKETEIQDLYQEIRSYELRHAETEFLYKKIDEFEREKKTLRQLWLERTEVYPKIGRIVSYYKKYSDHIETLTEDDWSELLSVPALADWLPESCLRGSDVLSEKEIRIACLLKIGLTVIEISAVMLRTRDAINKGINKIMDKLEYGKEMKYFLKDLASFL